MIPLSIVILIAFSFKIAFSFALNARVATRGIRHSFATRSGSNSATILNATNSAKDAAESNGITPIIVGGGISGLATSLALKNIAGVHSTILEKSNMDDFQDTFAGAGAQISPNGLKALRAIGGKELMQKCIDAGSIIKGTAIVLPGGSPPMIIPDMAEADTGSPQVFVRWGMLRKLLQDELSFDQGSILSETGGDICGYDVDDNGNVQLLANDNIALLKSDTKPNLIISAEGVRSKFRHFVNNEDRTILNSDEEQSEAMELGIKDTGRVNIKAIVPVDLDPTLFQEGHQYAWFAPDGGVGCFAGPAGPGYTYWAISIADAVDTETGAASKFLSAIDPKDSNAKGKVKTLVLEKLKSLDTNDCDLFIDLIEQSATERILTLRSEEAVKVGPSLQRDGKIVLVGDSAHAMSASYGQNPCLALEDAAVLACCLRDFSNLEEALKSYSEQLVSRCLEIQKRSDERAAKAMKGEKAEDISKWIFQWDIDINKNVQ